MSHDAPSPMHQVLRFRPIYQERVWGGQGLADRYGRELPEGKVIGESWEISDRPEAQSVVVNGPRAGTTLHELWERERESVFGSGAPDGPVFPLLVKILDARETLSLQVHPPDHCAEALGGEPKTEMWAVVHAEPGAALYCGVQHGVGPEKFAAALASGTVADCVPRLPVNSGDAIFIPSGRLHAIGAGLMIFEIQQNSDTTYRVFDWNRIGLDGSPRPLHVQESLTCIDFSDHHPELSPPDAPILASCRHFRVRRIVQPAQSTIPWGLPGNFCILAVVRGSATIAGESLNPGDFAIIPASLPASLRTVTIGQEETEFLETTFGQPTD